MPTSSYSNGTWTAGTVDPVTNTVGTGTFVPTVTPPVTPSAPITTPGATTPPATTTTTTPPTQTASTDYKKSIDDVNATTTALSDKFNTYVNNYQNGTVPLNAYETAQVEATRQSFNSVIEAQLLANKNYEAGVGVQNENMGLSRYSPTLAAGNVFAAVSEGNKKVADLNTKMNLAISTMQQGFQESNYKQVKDAYDSLVQAQKDKTAAIDKIYTVAKKHEDDVKLTAQEKTLNTAYNMLYDTTLSIEDRQKKIANLIASGTLTAAQLKDLQAGIDSTVKNEAGTGIVGEYNFYRKEAAKLGVTPLSFSEYQDQDANRKAKAVVTSQDPGRTLSATEAQALNVPFGTTAGQAYGKMPMKQPTEAQSKDAGYAQRTMDANKTINSLESKIAAYNPLSFGASVGAESSTYGNSYAPDEIKQMRQAERNFVNAVLRRESGSAINPSEFASAEKQYFPRPGDDAATLAQKTQNRKTVIQGLARSAGPALAETLGQPTIAEQQAGIEKQAQDMITSYFAAHPEKREEIKTQLNTINPVIGRKMTYSELIQAFPEYAQ